MIEIYTRNKLCEVIQSAYPENYKEYCDFFIVFNFKEQSSGSKYTFHDKTIYISTLSRSSADLFVACLKELAKHIDIKIRRRTAEDDEYYKILRKLLNASLKLHMIEQKDLFRITNDKLKSALQKNYGSFSNWKDKVEIPYDKIDVFVFESFMLKNVLRLHNFLYDPDQQCWTKTVLKDKFDELEEFVHKYEQYAHFVLINDNKYYIEPVYLIQVVSYSKEDAKLFHSYSYEFDKSRHLWTKTISARNIKQELKLIEDVPKQKVKISRPGK